MQALNCYIQAGTMQSLLDMVTGFPICSGHLGRFWAIMGRIKDSAKVNRESRSRTRIDDLRVYSSIVHESRFMVPKLWGMLCMCRGRFNFILFCITGSGD